jgi:hypothetical protein
MKRILLIGLAVLVGGFLLIQLAPYGRHHTNPPVLNEPDWDGSETRALAQRACFDCHSNQVVWPWYSNIAPVSWLVQRDVDEGREHLNFSDWDATLAHWEDHDVGEEMAETIHEGEMPLPIYLITHPGARLTNAEKTALANGLFATGGGSSEAKEREEEEDDD